MATAQEKRIKVRDLYRTILGRNKYSQAKRDYCFRKYSDGNYYSDCSSSISYCYKGAGYSFGILNTVGMYESSKLTKVPVTIKNGQILNPELLRIGDMLLFAGNDSGRKYAGYVGHVEMVGEINGSNVVLYGHGSGNPSKKDMVAYLKTRYNTKSSTALGHRGLIRVVRFIQDDDEPKKDESNETQSITVKQVQEALLRWDKNCLPKYGADGEWGSETKGAVMAFQKAMGIKETGNVDTATKALLFEQVKVEIVNGNCYVRDKASVSGTALGVVMIGTLLPYGGEINPNTKWNSVIYHGVKGWVSPLYSKIV